MPQFIYSESLTEETRELLRKQFPKGEGDQELLVCADELGCAKITLIYFRDGHTKNPNAQLAQAIYEKLSGNKLLTAA